jgi:hypothetical protein
MRKSEKIIKKVLQQNNWEAEVSPTRRDIWNELQAIKELNKYILDNELAHIWGAIKIIATFVLAILGAVIIQIIKG